MASKIDVQFIQSAIVIFVACIAFAVGAKYASQWYLAQAQESKKKVEQALQGAEQKLQSLRASRESYDTYHKSYAQLLKGGMFDKYGKVKWLDLAEEGRNNLQVPALNYEIGQQAAFQASYLPTATEAGVVSSDVALDAEILHEDDLVRLLDWFDRKVPGVLHFSDCELKQKQDITITYNPEKGNLDAKCHLKWLVILPIARINTGAPAGMEGMNGGMF